MNHGHARRVSTVGIGLQYAGLVALLVAILAPVFGLLSGVDVTALSNGTIGVPTWAVVAVAVAFPGVGSVLLGSALNYFL